MSQAKVEQYKKNKANRKQIMAKERLQKKIATGVAALVCVAVVGFAGFSAYNSYVDHQPAKTFYCDTTALDDYINSISE